MVDDQDRHRLIAFFRALGPGAQGSKSNRTLEKGWFSFLLPAIRDYFYWINAVMYLISGASVGNRSS